MIQFFTPILALGALASAAVLLSAEQAQRVESRGPEAAERIVAGFQSLQAGYTKFVTAHAAKPAHLNDFTPAFAFLPAAPQGMQWSFGTTGEVPGPAQWICLSGRAESETQEALDHLERIANAEYFFVGERCGSSLDTAPAKEASPIAATLIVGRIAVNP